MLVLIPLTRLSLRSPRCSCCDSAPVILRASPRALIGHAVPRTELPPLPGLERDGKAVPGLDSADFRGQVTVLNVWASWVRALPARKAGVAHDARDGLAPAGRRHELQGSAR